MSKIVDIPFNDGQDEGIDRFLLPEGKFRLLQNCRLDRDGRLNVRPNYAQLTTNTLPNNLGLVAFDLATHQENLIALGAMNTGFSNIHAYFPFILTAAGWAAQANASYHLISPTSELEIIYQAPYGNVLNSSDVAWTNNTLCFVTTDSTANTASAYVLDCTTNVVVNFKRLTSIASARVIAVGNKFVIVTRNTANSVTGYTFDTTAQASGFTVGNTFVSTIFGDSFSWDLAPIPGTSNFLMTWSQASDTTMKLRSYNTSFVQQAAISVASRNGNPAVISDGTSVVWAFTNGNNVEMRTLLISLAAVTIGPTNVLGPAATTGATPNIVGTPSLHFEAVSGTRAVTVQASSAGTGLGMDDSNWTIFTYVATHTNVNFGSAANVRMASKTVAMSVDPQFNIGIGLGTVIAGGNTSGTDQSYSTCLQLVEESQSCTARWNFGIADKLDGPSSSSNKHGRSSIATDGAGSYWACASVVDDSTVGTAGAGTLQIVKFKSGSADRRQSAEMQGALYIAGGYTYYYDRGVVAAESGFLDCPVVTNAVQATTAGALTLLATYQYIAVYEWQDTQGRTHRGQPSAPFSVTMTGTNNQNTITVSTPRSLRRSNLIGDANTVKIVLYRNTPLDSVFYRVGFVLAGSGASYAAVAGFVDLISDTVAQTRPILYTLSQKPTANVAMQPCRFLAAGRDRVIFGGLPDPYLVQFSQLAFPGEPIENASPNNFAYVARLPQKVTAVAASGDNYIAFTQDAVYQIPGSGPQRNGTGEFGYPHTLYADGGCINWKSVITCSLGTFFQTASDKLMLLAPTGGISFVGQPIRDQLTTYPNITGAALCTTTQRVVFSANDSATAPTGGVLLIYDLRRQIWTVDNVGSVTSVVEYLGRLAYLQGGNVFLENAAIGSGVGTLPTLSARTGSLKLFGGSGYGMLEKVLLQATYLGAGTLEAFISIDDGVTWDTMGTVDTTTLTNPRTGNAIAAGDPITISWVPKTRQVDRFAIRVDMTNSSDTGGSRLHMLSLEVDAKEFSTRQPANNRR